MADRVPAHGGGAARRGAGARRSAHPVVAGRAALESTFRGRAPGIGRRSPDLRPGVPPFRRHRGAEGLEADDPRPARPDARPRVDAPGAPPVRRFLFKVVPDRRHSLGSEQRRGDQRPRDPGDPGRPAPRVRDPHPDRSEPRDDVPSPRRLLVQERRDRDEPPEGDAGRLRADAEVPGRPSDGHGLPPARGGDRRGGPDPPGPLPVRPRSIRLAGRARLDRASGGFPVAHPLQSRRRARHPGAALRHRDDRLLPEGPRDSGFCAGRSAGPPETPPIPAPAAPSGSPSRSQACCSSC